MVFIQGSLSQYDVPRLAEEEGIQITQLGGRYTDEDWEILAEVLQGTTSLNSLQFDNCSVIALRNSKFIEALAKNHTLSTYSTWRMGQVTVLKVRKRSLLF